MTVQNTQLDFTFTFCTASALENSLQRNINLPESSFHLYFHAFLFIWGGYTQTVLNPETETCLKQTNKMWRILCLQQFHSSFFFSFLHENKISMYGVQSDKQLSEGTKWSPDVEMDRTLNTSETASSRHGKH